MNFRGFAVLLSLGLSFGLAKGQTLPVGLLYYSDDYFRRQQLLGNDSSRSSFMLRPLHISDRNNVKLSDDLHLEDLNRLIIAFPKLKAKVMALPVVWTQQFNQHHPYGMNDGLMIPSKGYQTVVSAGVYASIGPLHIQLRPEFVYADQRKFREIYETDNGRTFRGGYANYYNSLDVPESFGTGDYQKLTWGQSSIRMNVGAASLGLSNENLWWGPGIRNSLLMSNNAAGFTHLTLNTLWPVKTPIGSFEGQLIGGKLESSGVAPPPDPLFREKNDDWRYISGLMITYQPKWVPGLYLGIDRSYLIYEKDLGKRFFDYFPVFSGVQKRGRTFDVSDGDESVGDTRKFDQRLSFYARWVMPESHAELYFQYGKNDHSYNYRDAFVEPEHSRAYVAGFRKLFSLRQQDTYIQAGVEVTQMEAALTRTTRGAGYWYSHSSIIQGYTQQGQELGSGIGSGSNLQSLELSWVRGLKRIGLTFERTVHNNDLFYRAFPVSPDLRRHWVDLGLTGLFNWDYKRLVMNGQLAYVRSLNYQWALQERPNTFWGWDKQDADNFHLKIGLLYRW